MIVKASRAELYRMALREGLDHWQAEAIAAEILRSGPGRYWIGCSRITVVATPNPPPRD